MWKPYLNVIAKMLPVALNVLDRFHIARKLGEDVDEVRRLEAKQLAVAGYKPVLKNSRYCFLKRRSNLTIRQATKLRDLLKYDLKTLRALALKEAFDGFWRRVVKETHGIPARATMNTFPDNQRPCTERIHHGNDKTETGRPDGSILEPWARRGCVSPGADVGSGPA